MIEEMINEIDGVTTTEETVGGETIDEMIRDGMMIEEMTSGRIEGGVIEVP